MNLMEFVYIMPPCRDQGGCVCSMMHGDSLCYDRGSPYLSGRDAH